MEKEKVDIVASLIHRSVRNKILTKVDLRTREDIDLLKICKELGGGGHKKACGANTSFMPSEKLVKMFENFL